MYDALLNILFFPAQTNIQEDGFLELMNSDGSLKSDVKIPEGDIGDEIKAAFDDGKDVSVTVIAAMNEEAVGSLAVPGGLLLILLFPRRSLRIKQRATDQILRLVAARLVKFENPQTMPRLLTGFSDLSLVFRLTHLLLFSLVYIHYSCACKNFHPCNVSRILSCCER